MTGLDPARLLAGAQGRRWFRGKARPVAAARIANAIALAQGFTVVLLAVEYRDGPGETYVLPIATGAGDDAVADARFQALLLDLMRERAVVRGERGELAGIGFPALDRLATGDLTPKLGSAEQTNSAIRYGDRLLLKLFRAVEEGPNAEYEIGRFFATHGEPPRGVSRLVGALEHRVAGKDPSTIATLFEYVPNRGDAWSLTLAAVAAYLDGAGATFDRLRLLGTRTAEMHLALMRDPDDPLFAPEPFDAAHQAAIVASARALLGRTFALLAGRGDALDREARALAADVLARRAAADGILAAFADRPIAATRIRIHGDFHLGQVLDTGDDFVIIDFEGEPGRPLAERHAKLGPLRDVAGMLRSFDYAGAAALRARRADEASRLRARAFTASTSSAFLDGYLDRARGTALLPPRAEDIDRLLGFYLLEKCIYEVGYELNNRPDWVAIPLAGLRALLGGPA